ncbi:MAG TPA: 50S ribosomal protein L15 [Anaerolineae bacterium]|nr:50S ribosomal protein L15 [Anaerolineae bacterium]
MKLHELRPAKASKKQRKRVGRGDSSGSGKTSGRGTKGQKSRSGGNLPPYFEGGQLPLVKRLPHMRGFTNIFKTRFCAINLDRLNERFEKGDEVTPVTLMEAGLIKSPEELVKVLGRGELDKPLTVKAHGFSASARAKIEAAGGSVEELALPAEKPKRGPRPRPQ